jgi:predicted Ser/Thr protein kinase
LITRETNLISIEILDEAIKNALKHAIHFRHWFDRLRDAFKGNEFSFTKELLNRVSEFQRITSSEIVDLSIHYGIENVYNDIINALKHDGYINNNDDPKVYRFNSPLLRKWWYCNVAN